MRSQSRRNVSASCHPARAVAASMMRLIFMDSIVAAPVPCVHAPTGKAAEGVAQEVGGARGGPAKPDGLELPIPNELTDQRVERTGAEDGVPWEHARDDAVIDSVSQHVGNPGILSANQH